MIDVRSIEVKEQAVLVCLYFAMLHSKDARYHDMTTSLMTMSQRSDINYNTLKNYKDCFDPLFDNGRKGWHQNSLEQKNSYLAEIHQKYALLPLEEIEKAVKTILNNGKAETERSNVAQGGESMNFSDAILLVKDVLSRVDSVIAEKDYDGLMVKALSASNTLDVSRGATKQTHIAITGPQIDMFPYLRADGYFEPQYAEMDGDLKKYYIPAITVYLDSKNISYLANGSDSNIVFGESVTKETHMSVLRSRRKDSSDQIELGHPTYSSADFVSFRKLIHTNDYLILLKRKGQLVFEGFGISASQNTDLANSLSILNNKFFKSSTSTLIDVNAFNDGSKREIIAEPIPEDLSVEDLGKILREMYDAAIGGKVSAIHMFGLKYGPVIKAKNYSTAEIIRVAGIGESYNVEVSKGISIYKVIKDNEYGIRFVDADLVDDIPATYNDIPYAWYVGATGHDENGDWMDFSDQYIAEGRWENGWDDKFIDAVNSMEVGDRIAIKAAYTKKKGLPFNNCGQVVGVMAIKAIGVITENPKDGKNIKVQWEKVDPAREWYGSGVLRTTVHYVAADEGYTRKALLDFTFNNAPQDYSLCEEKYVDEDAVAAESEMNEPAFSPRTNKLHPLNSILYGAPGTGKTYITAEYALAIIENREVDESPKTTEERKAVMEKYRSYVNDERIVFTTFHQSYGYEDFIQGLRPVPANGGMDFVPVDGVFKHMADTAKWHPEDNYVIIIDEINRANISKVFGELITLIEDDKRWGEVNALQVTLPSGHSFKIPNNLYILGTMNSADKSISLIDTALRRRFEFIEVTPNASLIADPVLRSVLEKLNASLVKELDSTDLLVGHAYFIGKTEDDLCNIFNRSIIPLLYEYFYDNSTKVKAQIKNALPTDQYEIIGGSVGRIKISKK